MICSKCGATNDDNASFCIKCGNALNPVTTPQEEAVPETATQQATPPKEKKHFSKKIIFGIIAAVVVAVIAIVLIVINSAPTINLNDYIKLESTGYNGYGTASVSVDWDAIKDKYGDKIKFTDEAEKTLSGLSSYMNPVDTLSMLVSVNLENSNNLSNGDKVSYSWDVNSGVSKGLKCKLKYEDGTYDISGLEEVKKFDAFADLDVTFDGISPDGTISYTYGGTYLNLYDFSCDKKTGLSNGDKITISLNESTVTQYVTKTGAIPENLTKEYEVTGLSKYVSALSDLSDSHVEKLKKESEDKVASYIAKSFSSASTGDLTYAGYILDTVKADSFPSNGHNTLYLIYSAPLTFDKDKEPVTIYYPVKFSDLILDANDEITYSQNEIAGSSLISGTWYSTSGYLNPVICYNKLVEQYKNSYSFECGDGFEKYAEYQTLSSLDELDDTKKKSLEEDALNNITKYIEDKYGKNTSTDEIKVVGEYFLTSKSEDASLSEKNILYVVYSATVSSTNNDFETATVYYPVMYSGVYFLPESNVEYISCSGIQGHSSLSSFWYSTDGYIDGEKMFSDLISAKRDSYTYEMTEELQAFGK